VKTHSTHESIAGLAWSLVLLVGMAVSSMAGRAPPEKSGELARQWFDWWMIETCRQAVPTPQLLYVRSQDTEEDITEMEDMDGRLNTTGRILDLYPYSYIYQRRWYQANAGLIFTEAFVLPSALYHVFDEQEWGAVWIRSYYDGDLLALHVRPRTRGGFTFFWLRNMRIPATIHSSAVFAGALFEGDTPLCMEHSEAASRIW